MGYLGGTPPVGVPPPHVPAVYTPCTGLVHVDGLPGLVGLEVTADRAGLDSQDRQIVLPYSLIIIIQYLSLAHQMTDKESPSIIS